MSDPADFFAVTLQGLGLTEQSAVPQRKRQVVSTPSGSTVPFKIADVPLTAVAVGPPSAGDAALAAVAQIAVTQIAARVPTPSRAIELPKPFTSPAPLRKAPPPFPVRTLRLWYAPDRDAPRGLFLSPTWRLVAA